MFINWKRTPQETSDLKTETKLSRHQGSTGAVTFSLLSINFYWFVKYLFSSISYFYCSALSAISNFKLFINYSFFSDGKKYYDSVPFSLTSELKVLLSTFKNHFCLHALPVGCTWHLFLLQMYTIYASPVPQCAKKKVKYIFGVSKHAIDFHYLPSTHDNSQHKKENDKSLCFFLLPVSKLSGILSH